MLRKLTRKLLRWLKAREPVFCTLCLRLVFKKDAIYSEMTTGRIVPLCGKCHSDMFHPYSDPGEKQ
jgi:hypothetical protein